MAPLGLLLLLSQQPAPAPPPCDPVVFHWRLNATDAELSQGDISYLAVETRDTADRYLGHFVIAGDPDAPVVEYFVTHRHTRLTVTICAVE